MQKGFTLIELLVVVALLGVIGLITSQMFILNVRSQGKSEIIQEVKQSGDYAASVIESMVRNSADIAEASCNLNSEEVTILNQDGFSTTFSCDLEGKISSISAQVPGSGTSVPLTSSKVAVSNCTFRVVCPTPPLFPKYMFVTYTVSQVNPDATVHNSISLDYQTTISIRNYR